MKIKLIVIGKNQHNKFYEIFTFYIKKISHYISFELIEIPYLKNCKSLSEKQQILEEGLLLLKKVDSKDYVVLLDERGRELKSVDFANFIQSQANIGTKNLVFIIGGAYGFSKDVYERKDDMLSFSVMTFPHILMRTIFAEQLYRAFTILNHEPYHHQ